jgi:hypothetical protein
VADIHRRYGDYLYTKGDFDGAMNQFVKTLGHLQPSYVIRKVRPTFLARADDSTWMLSVYTISRHISKNSIPAN